MRRRRFLAIVAGVALTGRAAPPPPTVWRGVALGADASITLGGDPERAQAAIAAAIAAVAEVEQAASLRRPGGALPRLNAAGALGAAPPDLTGLLAESRAVHALSDGFFDPTVQPLWEALAAGGEPDRLAAARRAIGFDGVTFDASRVAFARPGMALTLNGVAQGRAADRAAAALAAFGYDDALVDMGELRALGGRPGGGDWRVAAAHPFGAEPVALPALRGRAAATSVPLATRVGPQGAPHVFDPVGAPGPRLASVTVVAATAARADALSTAAAAAPAALVPALLRRGGAEHAVLVEAGGAVRRLDL
jgi:thiamine biosynthesis lipoprotein